MTKSPLSQMGYAKPGQDTAGIHFRLYTRAFVIADQSTRVCIVSTDLAMISQAVKLEVSFVVKNVSECKCKCKLRLNQYLNH